MKKTKTAATTARKSHWFLWTLLVIAIILLAFRLYLPYFLINYVETQVNKIPEYRVKIPDLDVHLWRGAYTIINLQLWRIDKHIPVPFFSAKTIDLSVEWEALLQGSFVAKIVINEPVINFVIDEKGKNDQLSLDDQWLNIVKTLFPLNFNSITIHNGDIYFRSYTGNPPFKVYMHNAEMQMDNMQKVASKQLLLPSTFKFNAATMESGSVSFKGRYNPFDKQPTFKIEAALKSLDVSQIKSFLKHFTSVDVQSGTFSLYGEAAAADNEIKGYVKPFIQNLKIAPTKNSGPLDVLWDGAASVVAGILKNPDEKTIATKVNIEGRIDDPNTSIFSIIGYMIRHAFIQALLPEVDHNITMQDVIYGAKTKPSGKHN
jgi:hypothetical protein